jgi:hypothetical protein
MMDNLAKLHLRQPNGEIVEFPHLEVAANSPLGTNGFCNGGSGSFGSLQDYSSKPAQLLLDFESLFYKHIDTD